MDKRDAKVGAGPAANRTGQGPQGSLGANGHMDGHACPGTRCQHVQGPRGSSLCSQYPGLPQGRSQSKGTNARHPSRAPRAPRCGDGLGASGPDPCRVARSWAGSWGGMVIGHWVPQTVLLRCDRCRWTGVHFFPQNVPTAPPRRTQALTSWPEGVKASPAPGQSPVPGASAAHRAVLAELVLRPLASAPGQALITGVI